jgi:hypothetical protein
VIEALQRYRAEYDDRLRTLRTMPLYAWTSHAADAFCYEPKVRDNRGFYELIKYPRRGGDMTKKKQPFAVCTRCSRFTCDVEDINNSCGNKYGGERCKGVWRSALQEKDWAECSSCSGIGSQ